MTSVVWVNDGSAYLVSSLNHFKCIAAAGSGYSTSGAVPSNYLTASYKQTVNIDCSTALPMTPIGPSTSFTGVYDGQNYEIQNWQNDQNSTASTQGIFGNTNTGCVLKNIQLTGVCKVKGNANVGILVGNFVGSKMLNVVANFSSGSLAAIYTGSTTANGLGGLIGKIGSLGVVEKVRVKGYLTVTGYKNVGGVVGLAGSITSLRDVIISTVGNMTLTGAETALGGVVGKITDTGTGIYSGLINEITGDILTGSNASTRDAGGICGNNALAPLTGCVNRMKGNITAQSMYAGGICGYSTGNIIDCINVMEGNITCTANSAYCSGISFSTAAITRNLVAIKGNIVTSASVYLLKGSSTATATYNVYSNRFGMTINSGTVTSNFTGLNYNTLDSSPSDLSGGLITSWNDTKKLPIWIYTYTDSSSTSRTITSDDTNSVVLPSITWVLNNGHYEVSSLDHLKCIASSGTTYIASGSVPAYMSASYKQTANINCNGSVMTPIGTDINTFTGSYDGNGYEIQNWQNDQNSTVDNQSIFGYINGISSIIKNVSITGLCKIKGRNCCGTLIGNIDSGKVNNISMNLSNGSTIYGNMLVGGLIGNVSNSVYIEKINIRGYITINGTSSHLGGIIGYANGYLRDAIISIIGSISGIDNIGGIIGSNYGNVLYGVINEIQGSINGSSTSIGGICGYSLKGTYCSINRMIGNISGSGYVGGIVGNSTAEIEDNINVMEGNITATTTTYCGGIGYTSMTNPSIKRNVLAMKGATPAILCYTVPSSLTNVLNNVYSNRNGMTVGGSTITTSNGTAWYYDTLDVLPTQLSASPYITGWNDTKKVPVWIYTYTDSLSVSQTIMSDTLVAAVLTNINWNLNNGSYEVSSINHLLCISYLGNLGSKYTSNGSIPTNYMSANYRQISNLDCTGCNITSIGSVSNNFIGSYDGQGFEIQNLSYIDTLNTGLFNYTNNSTIKNIKLSNTLNVKSNISYGGIVHTALNNTLIDNCKVVASGNIDISSNVSLICNNFIGSNNVINKCYTNFSGTIKTNNLSSNSISGIFLGNSSYSNNYVLYCTNENIGDTYLGYSGGGIVGSNVNVYGCINKMTGNLNGHSSSNSYYIGGIAYDANVNCCINDMKGHLGLSTNNNYVSGISGKGTVNNSINCMVGNINSTSGYGISKNAVITNSFNYMKGDTFDLVGGNVSLSSNVYIASSGSATNRVNSNYKNYYGTLQYGLSNSNANVIVRNDIWNALQLTDDLIYLDSIKLPIIKSNLSITVNCSNYVGLASNWEISFPLSNYTEYKYKFDSNLSKYILYTKLQNNSVITSIPINLDNSTIPYQMLGIIKDSNLSTYKDTIQSLVSTPSNNISSVQEAIVYQTLSNQKQTNNVNYYDFSDFTDSLKTYKDIYKPAIKNVLTKSLESNNPKIIKNLDNSLFDVVIKDRATVDKLCIPSNVKLSKDEVSSLFSNQTDLLLLDNTIYTIDFDGPVMLIDTNETTTSNVLKITYDNSNYTLSTSNTSIDINYGSNQWKKINITGFGSALIETLNLSYVVYNQDILNNYLIENEDQIICIANNGVGYHVDNAPSNYYAVNYKQESNLNFELRSNIMIEEPFTGIFDGNSKEFNNLNYSSTDSSNYALFNTIDNAIIKNIVINSNLNVIGSNINYGGVVYTACNNSLIENCKITATGLVNIGGSHSFICNNTQGQYTIINKCITNYIGNVNCGNNSGSLLGDGNNVGNTYIIFSTNKNKGDYTGNSNIGGLVGNNATVFNSMNMMEGNLVSSSNVSGIVNNGNVIASINAMNGNISGNLLSSGINSGGLTSNCINCMNSNIQGNGYGIGYNSTITNSLNVMRGDISGVPIGGNINSSNNVCVMYGNTTSSNVFGKEYCITDYGYNNSISQLQVIDTTTLKTKVIENNYMVYSPDFELPYIPTNLTLNVNNSNYTNQTPYWTNLYPNVSGNSALNGTNNLYAIRTTDSALVKMNVSNYIIDDILGLIEAYIVFSKTVQFTFNWDENVEKLYNIAIGKAEALKTLDIEGDLNIGGSIYDGNDNRLAFWLNSNNCYYYNKGNVGIGTNNPQYLVDVLGGCRSMSFYEISDSNLKYDIENDSLGVDFINRLQPKTFNYITDSNQKTKHGLIAQDLIELGYTEFVNIDDNGYYSINLKSLIGPIVNTIKELSQKNKELREKILSKKS